VATREGSTIHLHCAEQEAARAWKWRRQRALIQGAASGVAVIVSYLLTGQILYGIWLGALWLIVHVVSNRRWWYYIRRDAIGWVKRASLRRDWR
jgi:hypothetical protein